MRFNLRATKMAYITILKTLKCNSLCEACTHAPRNALLFSRTSAIFKIHSSSASYQLILKFLPSLPEWRSLQPEGHTSSCWQQCWAVSNRKNSGLVKSWELWFLLLRDCCRDKVGKEGRRLVTGLWQTPELLRKLT